MEVRRLLPHLQRLCYWIYQFQATTLPHENATSNSIYHNTLSEVNHTCSGSAQLCPTYLFLPVGLLKCFCSASDTSQNKSLNTYAYQPTTHPQHRHHRCMDAETKNTNPKLNTPVYEVTSESTPYQTQYYRIYSWRKTPNLSHTVPPTLLS